DFPKPRKLGMNSVAWVENEVEQWLKNLPYH
ncbi:MAG TPA: AlpA family transcriptional regulator, partial [Acinetobacter radioresistens]|nr:AlpA family transcriptional regulator [Acinetobacter radioresistens]